ncbi:gephyrin-like molybdotransferase Glp [uncultured Sulfitobacter sp.]|uniref:molybdopterin-binding protein n=1 Tax=uncultured Sulfitobacter sp. TaxID=191468 RepID=UPI002628A1B0|nr:gephyrin-like molybdotransferase Glp [uncultured Sulfitobacter sp.]
MSGFATFLVVDWSAGKRAGPSPRKDSIWLGLTREGQSEEPVYCRSRQEAEDQIKDLVMTEKAAGRRMLCAFDFPFGYPQGFARHVTGSDDPLQLWDWFEARITDAPDGTNNRYEVAETLNRLFTQPGPFWGKPSEDKWPDVPFRKKDIVYDMFAEKRACDRLAKAASSCFQLAFPPTVGGQMMMGLPTLNRLRRITGVSVWPFEDCAQAEVVLAEIWPGVIEKSVKARLSVLGQDAIRDREQVRLLAEALSQLPVARLSDLMYDLPEGAREEAWILGAGVSDVLDAVLSPAPPLRNDCFALPQGVHWTPVEDALDRLRVQLTSVTGTESVRVIDAAGRISANDVKAKRANPPLPNTAVDGYGFAGGRCEGTHRLPLVAGRAAAGDAPGAVPASHAIRVLTGAALPDGVDTVILQEDVTVQSDHIAFSGAIKQGANTRRAGEDVASGDVVLRAGRRLTAADLALLSATGVADLDVRQRLRVGILSTGDELVSAGEAAGAGQIFDANRPMLLAMIAQLGHEPVDLGTAPDDRAGLREMLDAGATQVDAILTSGGASAGDEDHMSALLRAEGTVTTWRIAIKPGRPLALGQWRGVPVFGLPGNPVAAMVCTLVFARPALAQLAGAAWTVPQGFEVPAAFIKRKKAGRREYLRARIVNGQAEVFRSEGSGRISGLSWADGLVELDTPARDIGHGDMVRYIPFSSFGLS